MATYKLIQDIEAEDHILGPLTLRQFIFALISVLFFYICFVLLTKHVAFLLVIFLPPALFFGFFAIPFGRDQPTEIWMLAKLRFWFKPRKRIWDQRGVKQLVTITVPKKIERVLTNGLNSYEVESRLKALANTLDSRGWAIKNSVNGTISSKFVVVGDTDSDRLVAIDNQPFQSPDDQIPEYSDILNEDTSAVAQNLDHMINETSQAHRKELIDQMNSTVQQQSNISDNQWFMPHQSNDPLPVSAPVVVAQDETSDESTLSAKLKAQHNNQQIFSSNLRTIQPISSQSNTNPVNNTVDYIPSNTTKPPLTDVPDPAILSLANNNDFTVDTIAREAKRAKNDGPDKDEVVISLR